MMRSRSSSDSAPFSASTFGSASSGDIGEFLRILAASSWRKGPLHSRCRVRADARCTMAEMFARLDAQVAAQEFETFPGYRHRPDTARADRHVDQQIKWYEVEGLRFGQEFWQSIPSVS